MKRLIIIAFLLLIVFPVHAMAEEQKVEIEIKGMTCTLCSLAVKKSLKKIDGVKDIEVSFKDGKAWCITDDSITDEVLTKAVEKAGAYKVQSIRRE